MTKEFMRCIMCGEETEMPKKKGIDSASCSECEKTYGREKIMQKIASIINQKQRVNNA